MCKVRFHPRIPTLVASGSLDYEVRLWNVVTGDCIGSHDFGRPIASMSFCADGSLMAIASGHKVCSSMRPGSSVSFSVCEQQHLSGHMRHIIAHCGQTLWTQGMLYYAFRLICKPLCL